MDNAPIQQTLEVTNGDVIETFVLDTTKVQKIARGTRVRQPIKSIDQGLMVLRERTAEAELQRQVRVSSIVLNEVLPLWSEEIRAVPNPFLRSGLFSVSHDTDANREFRDNEKIVSLQHSRHR